MDDLPPPAGLYGARGAASRPPAVVRGKGAGGLRMLVTSAGRRVALVDCFRAAAKALGTPLTVHAADMAPGLSAACLAADRAHRVPPCGDGYVEALLALARAHRIDLLVPTIDPELLPVAAARGAFAAAGTLAAVSDAVTIRTVRDKVLACDSLRAAGVAVPRTAPLEDARLQPARFAGPLIVKPVAGSASRGIVRLPVGADLPPAGSEPMMVQELLDGPEYTVNVFVDRGGTMRAAIPHRRLSIRAGEVEKGRTVRDPRFTALARALCAAIPGLRGAFCFQFIDDVRRGPCVIEINARFGGGYPLADRAGGHFARWLLEEALGRAPAASDDWREGITMLRYDAAVFVDD